MIYAAILAGTFLAMLDVQITNAIIPVLGTDLGAPDDQFGLVQTAYLGSEIVTIALSRAIVERFSARVSFSIAALAFAVTSLACAASWNIGVFLVARFAQGLSAGVLIPIAFRIRFRLFSNRNQVELGSIVTLVLTCAPTFGPSIGAWLTSASSWRIIFVINAPVLAFVAFVVSKGSRIDDPDELNKRPFPWITAFFVSTSLVSFHAIVETFSWEHSIFTPASTAWLVVLITSLGVSCYSNTHDSQRLISFSVFGRPLFVIGFIIAVSWALINITLALLIPLYFQSAAPRTIDEVARIMLVGGLAQMAGAPFLWIFARHFTNSMWLALGLTLLTVGLFLLTRLQPWWGVEQMFAPQVLRGFAFMLLAVPAEAMIMSGLPDDMRSDASVFFNAGRNIISIAGITLSTVYIQVAYEQMFASGAVGVGFAAFPGEGSENAEIIMASLAITQAYQNILHMMLFLPCLMAMTAIVGAWLIKKRPHRLKP